MMNSNKGTYVTTNTLLSIAKYDNIIRFDSDDIMLPNMVEFIMNKKGNSDVFRFYLRNFGEKKDSYFSDGICFFRRSFILRYGGYQPWKCGADTEMKKRLNNFGVHNSTREILFLRRVHNNSLTRKDGETKVVGGIGSYRKEKIDYVRNLKINNENDAKIELVTNAYTEVFSDNEKTNVDLKAINEKIDKILGKKTVVKPSNEDIEMLHIDSIYNSDNIKTNRIIRKKKINKSPRLTVKKHDFNYSYHM